MRALLLLLVLSAPAFAQSSWSDALLPTAAATSSNFGQVGATPNGDLYYGTTISGSATTSNLIFKIYYVAAGTTTSVDVTGNYPMTGCNSPRIFVLAPNGGVWSTSLVQSVSISSPTPCGGTAVWNEDIYRNAGPGSNVWTIAGNGPGTGSNPRLNATSSLVFSGNVANRANGSTCFTASTLIYCNTPGSPLTLTNLGAPYARFPYATTSVAAAVSGNTTYTGTFGYIPPKIEVFMAGNVNAANNGGFVVVSSTSTTLTVVNASGVAETTNATASPDFTHTNTGLGISYGLVAYDAQDGLGECMYDTGEGAVIQFWCSGTNGTLPAQIQNAFVLEDWSSGGGASGTGWRADDVLLQKLNDQLVTAIACQNSNPSAACTGLGSVQLVLISNGSSRTQTVLPLSNGYHNATYSPVQNIYNMGGTGSSTAFDYFVTSSAGRWIDSTTNNGSSFTNLVAGMLTLFPNCANTTSSFVSSIASDGTNIWAVCKDSTANIWRMGRFGPAMPTPVSIALTPNPFTIAVAGTQTLTCTTTLSDSSTRACISPSLVSSDPTKASVSGMVVTGVAAGTGTITGTAESLTSPTDAFTVTGGTVTTNGSAGGNSVTGGNARNQ